MSSGAGPKAAVGHDRRVPLAAQPLESPAAFVSDLYCIGFSERPADRAGVTLPKLTIARLYRLDVCQAPADSAAEVWLRSYSMLTLEVW
jgi:hypothetical protein